MNERFQSKIISEIIDTEKSYLLQLEKLQNFFSKPSLEKGLLPSHVHSAIFSQLSAIYQMNSKLLEEITEEENVGSSFLKFGPFLKVYSSYANNFQRSLEILQKWENENEAFKSFITATETRPEVQSKLSSLLITPIQRIPRYKLLLDELLKYSDTSSHSYKDLEGAVLKVTEAAKHIDRSVFEAQAFNHLLLVQRALKDQQPNIIAPGRKLIKEGILNKVSRKGKGSQSRLFFLFTDMLIYTKLPSHNMGSMSKETINESAVDTDLKPNSLECCCMLPLRYCRVTRVFGSSDQGITFRLQCSDEDLLLYSAISSEGEAWISAIKGATQEALRKRQTLRKASSRRKVIRKLPLRNIECPEELQDESSTPEPKSPKFFFELETLKTHLLNARDCLTPPKPCKTSRQKKIQPIRTKKNLNNNNSLVIQTQALNGCLRISKPLSPLATCSYGNGSNPLNGKLPFVYQSGVRGREGSQLTPSPSIKGKKRPLVDRLLSPRKKTVSIKT